MFSRYLDELGRYLESYVRRIQLVFIGNSYVSFIVISVTELNSNGKLDLMISFEKYINDLYRFHACYEGASFQKVSLTIFSR